MLYDINTFNFKIISYNDSKGGAAMNFTPFTPNVTTLPPTVTTLPPIVTRNVNVLHRFNIVNQPHIHEDITHICNHHIKRHFCCRRPICREHCDFREEFCGCPGQMRPGFGGFPGQGQFGRNNVDIDIDINDFDDVEFENDGPIFF